MSAAKEMARGLAEAAIKNAPTLFCWLRKWIAPPIPAEPAVQTEPLPSHARVVETSGKVRPL